MSVFPSQTSFVTGDILTATAMNEIGQAINLLDGAQGSAGKNRVLNSNYSVWQRGTSLSTAAAASAYTADRWQVRTVAANMANTVSRQVTNDTTNLPNIQYCARVQKNSGQTGAGLLIFEQGFESVNSIPLAGKTVVLSFYARAGANFSAASSVLVSSIVSGTGTDQMPASYTGGVYPTQNNTLTTTWQRFTYSVTIPTNATEVATQFYYTTVGTAGANDYFEITGVQLEAANSVSNYAPNGATYQAELAACQRYYYRAGGDAAFQRYSTGLASTTTNSIQDVIFPVTMRVIPTAIDFSTLALYDGVTLTAATNAAINTQSRNIGTLNITVASGLTQFRPYELIANNSTSSFLGFTAEL
jgi:hypothetical protein